MVFDNIPYHVNMKLPSDSIFLDTLTFTELTFTVTQLADIIYMKNLPKYERILDELMYQCYSKEKSLLSLVPLFYFSIKNNSRYHLIQQEDPKSYILESSSREEKYLIYLINNEECFYTKYPKNIKNLLVEDVYDKEKIKKELYKKFSADLVNKYEEEFIKYSKILKVTKRLKFKEIEKEIHANFNKILELHDMDYIEYLKEKGEITGVIENETANYEYTKKLLEKLLEKLLDEASAQIDQDNPELYQVVKYKESVNKAVT